TDAGNPHVDTFDSRVQLRIDRGTTTGLDEDHRRRVIGRLAPRLTRTVLTDSAEEHRSQHRNRTAARRRLTELLRETVMPEAIRRPTKPTRASKRRRLEGKRRRAESKRRRQRPGAEWGASGVGAAFCSGRASAPPSAQVGPQLRSGLGSGAEGLRDTG